MDIGYGASLELVDTFCYLRSLETHKATGPDGIPTHLLKITAEEATSALQLLF